MQDNETGSYWSHVTGEALSGKLKGERLVILPVVQTKWSKWFASHPQTKVLKKDKEIRSSNYQRYFRDPKRTGLFRSHWLMERMSGKQLVHGVTIGPHAIAVVRGKLKAGEIITGDLANQKLLFVMTEDGGVRAFLAKVGGRNLTFVLRAKRGKYHDRESNSTWDLERGVCLQGELKGSQLEQLSVIEAYWFAWSTFYPNTEVLD